MADEGYNRESGTAGSYWPYDRECICGQVFRVSQSQFVKNGWGSMGNFLASYGLNDIQEGNLVLQQMIGKLRAQFIKEHKACRAHATKANSVRVTIKPLLKENEEFNPSFTVRVDPEQKVIEVAKRIHQKYDCPVPQIQVSVFIDDKQVMMKKDKLLNEYGVKDEDELFWLFVPPFMIQYEGLRPTSKIVLAAERGDLRKVKQYVDRATVLHCSAKKMPRVCAYEGCDRVTAKLRVCRCCWQVFYCSKQHQKAHWKWHKPRCNAIKAQEPNSRGRRCMINKSQRLRALDVYGGDGNDVFHLTPIAIAAYHGECAVVRYLLEMGADPTLQGRRQTAVNGESNVPMDALKAGADQLRVYINCLHLFQFVKGFVTRERNVHIFNMLYHMTEILKFKDPQGRAKQIVLKRIQFVGCITLLEAALPFWQNVASHRQYQGSLYDKQRVASGFPNRPSDQNALIAAISGLEPHFAQDQELRDMTELVLKVRLAMRKMNII